MRVVTMTGNIFQWCLASASVRMACVQKWKMTLRFTIMTQAPVRAEISSLWLLEVTVKTQHIFFITKGNNGRIHMLW